jgi:hypothetical protein
VLGIEIRLHHPSDSETWIKRQTGLRALDIDSLITHGYIIRGQNSENIKKDANTASVFDAKRISGVMQNDADSHQLLPETETDIQNPPISPHGDFALSGETEKPAETIKPVASAPSSLSSGLSIPRRPARTTPTGAGRKPRRRLLHK